MALSIDELNIQITSDSSKATRALTSLIKKLEKLKSTLDGTSTSGITITNSFNQTTEAAQKTEKAVNKYDNANKKSSQSTQKLSDKLAKNISKWRTLFGVFQNAADTMGGWFKESNDYIETLNLFNVTMGDAADSAYNYAESVQKLMGIDIEEWMSYQGTFKQLTSGFGVASDSANVMSQNLTQLSYDMASFFNTDVETAFDKLSSAMAGQVKGLRDYGIDVTVASLQEYAFAKGIDKKVRSMTQAEKAMLRYNYIMEKSINMQGDMARTIITPANALRILQAQLTQLKRALGNVVSVLVAKMIPYVQVFVQLMTEAAQKLALFFGFEIQEIDYSGLGGGFADEMEDAEDALDGTSDKLKKIKKQLMGFDELNIINNPDTGSDSGSGGAAAGGGTLDIKPLEYDFLSGLDTSKADELYSKIKKFLSPLKKIANYLDDYEDTAKAIIGVFAGIALIKWLKNVGKALGALGFVQYFLDGFHLIKATGGNFFQSFTGGISNVRNNLTGMQKAAIVAAAAIIEFVAIKDSVKALAMGCEDVGAKIVTIGVVATAAGAAMYVALGPAGIAIAAIVGLTGAIVGVHEANQEMMSQMVSDVFYDDAGVKITDLADNFKSLMDSIVATNQPILDNKANIDDAAKSIGDANSSVEYLITSYERGIISTEEFSTKVSEEMAMLRDKVKITMDAIYGNIIYALSTSLGDAIEEAGGSVQEYLTIIGKIKEDGDTLYGSLVQKQNELSTNFASGKISAEEYAAGLRDVNEKMSALSGSTSIVTTFSDKIEGLRKTVNWEDPSGEAQKTAFDTINTSAADAKAAVNESCDEIKRNLQTMKAWTTDQEALAALDELLLGNEESRNAQLSEIDTAVNTMYDHLQTDVLGKIDAVTAEAQQKWDSMNGWERFWSGSWSEAEYVEKAIQTYRKDFADPLSGDIQASMDQLGTDGSVWLVDAVDKITSTAFDYSPNDGAGKYVTGYSAALGKDVKDMLTSSGKDATQGFQDGVLQTISGVEGAFTQMAERAIDAVAETQDSHSPAKEYIALAKDAIDGYVVGVEDNFPKISDAFADGFDNVFDDISKDSQTIFSSSTWSGYAKNITNALANIKMPKLSNIGLSVSFDTWVSADKEKVYKALGLAGFPRLSWYTYAQGGFPSVGQMFIAREAGPELVGSIGRKTAVANNDQIIDGIYNGVYRAMMAANNGKGGNVTVNATFEMDGEVVGRKVIKYHNGVVMQTGESPLLV